VIPHSFWGSSDAKSPADSLHPLAVPLAQRQHPTGIAPSRASPTQCRRQTAAMAVKGIDRPAHGWYRALATTAIPALPRRSSSISFAHQLAGDRAGPPRPRQAAQASGARPITTSALSIEHVEIALRSQRPHAGPAGPRLWRA